MDDFILNYWNEQAEKFGGSYAASWQDLHAVKLEIETIAPFILPGDRVLDVGCANGYSLLMQLEREPGSLTGVDFSPAMIEQAQLKRYESARPDIVSFEVGDIRKLRFEDQSFDVVYTTRTLINLPTWEEQQQALLECLRVCKSGGRVIFSEAFWEPLALLNALRALKSLPPLVEHDFNRYLKQSRLEAFFRELNITFQIIDFTSVYYLGSRFLRELVTDPESYPDFSNPINELFYQIEREYSGGGFGIQQAYVVHR